MPTPTPSQVLAEITDAQGPLFAQYAPHWAMTFGATVDAGKQGREWRASFLLPDAAQAILDLLQSTATGRTRTVETMTRGALVAKIAPLILGIPALEASKKEVWALMVTAITGGDDIITITRPEIQGLFDQAVTDGLMTQQYRAGLANAGTVACSRAEELGWTGLTLALVGAAKKLEA